MDYKKYLLFPPHTRDTNLQVSAHTKHHSSTKPATESLETDLSLVRLRAAKTKTSRLVLPCHDVNTELANGRASFILSPITNTFLSVKQSYFKRYITAVFFNI